MSTTNDKLREKIEQVLAEEFGFFHHDDRERIHAAADRLLAALPSPGGEREKPGREVARLHSVLRRIRDRVQQADADTGDYIDACTEIEEWADNALWTPPHATSTSEAP